MGLIELYSRTMHSGFSTTGPDDAVIWYSYSRALWCGMVWDGV